MGESDCGDGGGRNGGDIILVDYMRCCNIIVYCNGVDVLPLPWCGNMLTLYHLVVRGCLVPEEWMDEDIEKTNVRTMFGSLDGQERRRHGRRHSTA